MIASQVKGALSLTFALQVQKFLSLLNVHNKYTITKATIAHIPEIELLINESVWKLAIDDYTEAQIEGALQSAWGVDSQLIEDGTYFIVKDNNKLVGCGGWSYRETLFGNNNENNRSSRKLNPKTDSARIRAFFVKPEHARKGIGTALINKCETEAQANGFSRFSLMATLPGQRLYARHGFIAEAAIQYPLGENLSIKFVPMYKTVPNQPQQQ